MHRRTLLLSLLAALPAGGIRATAKASSVNADSGLGISGYDPVAYFTDGKATPGEADISALHDGVIYRFATSANRSEFLSNPLKFLPQYGGYCAYGMARGYKAVIDPNAFTIVGDRLYLNYNLGIQDRWRRQQTAEISRADASWPKVKDSTDVAR